MSRMGRPESRPPAHELDRSFDIAVKEPDTENLLEPKLLPSLNLQFIKKSIHFSYTVVALVSKRVKREVTF